MGWVEVFSEDFESGLTGSAFKIIGDVDLHDAGITLAVECATDLNAMLHNSSLLAGTVVGIKASYDDALHVVLYLHEVCCFLFLHSNPDAMGNAQAIGAHDDVVEEVAAVASRWGAHSLRLGMSAERGSPTVKLL